MQGHSARRATVNGMHSAESLFSSWSTDRTICVRAWRGKWRVHTESLLDRCCGGMCMCMGHGVWICVHSVRSRARAAQPVTGTFVKSYMYRSIQLESGPAKRLHAPPALGVLTTGARCAQTSEGAEIPHARRPLLAAVRGEHAILGELQGEYGVARREGALPR